jgi:hypothetical protein
MRNNKKKGLFFKRDALKNYVAFDVRLKSHENIGCPFLDGQNPSGTCKFLKIQIKSVKKL